MFRTVFCRGGVRRFSSLLFGADEEDGDRSLVPYFMNGAAEQEIAQQSMSVAGHGNEAAVFPLGRLENLTRRIAQREMGRHLQSLAA